MKGIKSSMEQYTANVVTSVDEREAPSRPRAAASIVASRAPGSEPRTRGVLPLQVLFGGREVRRRLQR